MVVVCVGCDESSTQEPGDRPSVRDAQVSNEPIDSGALPGSEVDGAVDMAQPTTDAGAG